MFIGPSARACRSHILALISPLMGNELRSACCLAGRLESNAHLSHIRSFCRLRLRQGHRAAASGKPAPAVGPQYSIGYSGPPAPNFSIVDRASRRGSMRSMKSSAGFRPGSSQGIAAGLLIHRLCRQICWPHRDHGAGRLVAVPAVLLIGIPMYSNAAGIIPEVTALPAMAPHSVPCSFS